MSDAAVGALIGLVGTLVVVLITLEAAKRTAQSAVDLSDRNSAHGRLDEHEKWLRGQRADVYVKTLEWVWNQNMWAQTVARLAGVAPIDAVSFDQTGWGYMNASLQAVGSDAVIAEFKRIVDQFKIMEGIAHTVRRGPPTGPASPAFNKAAFNAQQLSGEIDATGDEIIRLIRLEVATAPPATAAAR